MITRALPLAISLLALPANAIAPNPAARDFVLSGSDCVGAENIIAEDARAPLNTTFIRVQHIGDPGTEELAREVANVVTWNVGAVTGLDAPPLAQRGYKDLGLPTGTSAFQLSCESAGFLINTWQFNHSSPLFGEGPSASIGRELAPAPQPFDGPGSTLLIDARVKVPWVYAQTPPVAEGTAQVSFFYYAQDAVSGSVFVHVIQIFDNRPASVGGTGSEYIGSDGVTAFVSSPMLATDTSGKAVRYVRVARASATMRFVMPWSEATYFRVEIPYENFRAMLSRLKAEALPAASADPADYRILFFGVLAETLPGTGSEHNVSLGGSVADLTLAVSRPRLHAPR